MCTNYLGNLGESTLDFTLEKMVRLQMVVDKIGDAFPESQDLDRGRPLSFPASDLIRPIQAQLDKIAESIDHVHLQFRQCSGPHTLPIWRLQH